MYRKEIALDPGSWPREYRGSSTGTGVFYVRSPLGKAGRPEKGSRLREIPTPPAAFRVGPAVRTSIRHRPRSRLWTASPSSFPAWLTIRDR